MRSVILLLAAALCCGSVHAAVPHQISYQGYLTDAGGTPVHATVSMALSLYDDPVLSGLHQLYTETQSVPVVNGVFNVLIGSVTTLSLPFDIPYWLGVKVGTDAEMTPRQKLAASPYAIRSVTAEALAAGATVPAAQITGTVGSATTATKLATPRNINGALFDGTADITVPGTMRWQIVAGTFEAALPNTRYVATNAAEVTVTLPVSPSPGDLIGVSGAGEGGWKIVQNSGQRILLPGSGYLISNWTSPRNWASVSSSVDGGKLAAVEFNGQIWTSTDSGISWTPRDSNRQWTSVASSADGSRLVAGGYGDQIYTSVDGGVSWIPRDTFRNWYSVASSSDGIKLVALDSGGQIYTSTDSGVSWTPRDTFRNWYSVASSSDGSKLVAAEFGGKIYTSIDSGASWTPRDSDRPWYSVASSSDGSKLVAAEFGGKIYTSIDSGASWTPRDSNRAWYSVTSSSDGSKLVALVSGGMIYTSADSGASWTPRDSNRAWTSVASSSDGSKLVAVTTGRIYSSIDSGVTWTSTRPGTQPGTAGYLSGEYSTSIELQYLGGGLFLPVSHEGTPVAY